MVKKKIRETILKNSLINRGEHIVIGLSGGPDSVCLFSVLKELSDEMDFSIYAVHVNHGFRPGAAEADQEYSRQLCENFGVEFRTFKYDCPAIAEEEGLSGEEAGRKVRYASFVKAAEELINSGIPQEKVKIAVAQNADDQAETVLFRLLRGTGPDGLAGMAYSRMEQNICVIRPILDTWRKDIEEYCMAKELQPRTDHTNLEPVYTRNKIRLQLIPYLEENFNPNIMEALGRLSRIAGEDKAYLWQQAEEAYEKIKTGDGKMDQKELKNLPQSIRYRVIMKAFQQSGLEQDISAAHLEAADNILDAEGESKTVDFPGGYRFTVRYGEAAVLMPKDNDCYQEAVFSSRVLSKNEFDEKDNMSGKESCAAGSNRQQAAFDYDKITDVFGAEPKIEFRSRKEGDYLPLKDGRKKLQNLLVDMKVPKENRDKVKFAAIGREIIWIPEQPEQGIIKSRYNPKYKLDMDTKKALLLEKNCEI